MSTEKSRSFELSNLFQRFKKIPERGHHDFVAFCNYYRHQISELDFDEYIEIKYAFIKALYHLERNHLFHKATDQFLQELLNQKTFDHHIRSIYLQVLEIKAQQLTEERRSEEATEIRKAMLLLSPRNKYYKKKLFHSLFLKNQVRFRKHMGIAIMLLIISLCINISNQLFVAPFASQAEGALFYTSLGFLLFSVSFILFSLSASTVMTKNEIETLTNQRKRTDC